MKRRLAAVFAVLAVAAAVAAVAYFASRPEKEKPSKFDSFRYDAVWTHAVAIALAEKPDSDCIRAVKPLEEALRKRCEKMGMEFTLAGEANAADIVFITGDEFGKGGKIDFAKYERETVDGGEVAIVLDVRKMTAARFKEILSAIPHSKAHLWMISERDWLVTARKEESPRLCSDILSLFSFGPAFDVFLDATIEAPWDVFASYAGEIGETMGAFAGDLSVEVRPEFFVSRDIPEVKWLERDDVEEDIFANILRETRSVQVVRRVILEGNMFFREKGDSEKAISKWASAYLRNPRDSMLLERLYTLAVNAKAFSEIGNLKGAAKCYETMISVNPRDIAALEEFSKVTARLGMLEVSRAAKARAKKMQSAVNKKSQIQ